MGACPARRSADAGLRFSREVNRINQLVVEPTLRTTRDPAVFAIGDCAQCPRPVQPSPLPPCARRRISRRCTWCARSSAGCAASRSPYVYRDFGPLVSLGRWSMVGNLMGFLLGRSIFIEGLFARLMYRSLRFMHERALGGMKTCLLGATGLFA